MREILPDSFCIIPLALRPWSLDSSPLSSNSLSLSCSESCSLRFFAFTLGNFFHLYFFGRGRRFCFLLGGRRRCCFLGCRFLRWLSLGLLWLPGLARGLLLRRWRGRCR